MAPRIDFTHLARLFEERARLADWQALLDRATLPTVATDYAVRPELEHALVDFLGLDWETAEGYEGLYANYKKFVSLIHRKRNTYQKKEVGQLHRLWQESRGRSELSADMSLEAVLRKFQCDVGSLIQGGQAMVGDLFTLPIDPTLLNGGLTNFTHGRGQIMFMVALAVVTGKHDYPIQLLPKTAQGAGTKTKPLKWKKLPIDWRRGYVILRDMGDDKNWWQQFKGLEGYRKFTFRYADGDMKKGFTIASAMLEMQGRGKIAEVLKWQGLSIKTSKLSQIKQALDNLITKAKQSDYDALGDYTTWSNTWAGGNMHEGFMIASALLEMQGKGKIGEVLKWQALPINTSQLPKLKQALDDLIARAKQANYDALGEYTTWSNTWAGGNMHKGFTIASALLEMQGKGKIGEVLKWQGLKISTSQLSKFEQALDDLIARAKQANYDALGEYTTWSNTWTGGDMKKGFTIASAFLKMQGRGGIGEVLKWHELFINTANLAFIAEARVQANPPSTIAIPQKLVGVIIGQSFTGLRKMLSMSPANSTLTLGSASEPAASASVHVSGLHIASSEVHGIASVAHSPALVRAATILIQGQSIITDGGIKGALALAPEIEIVAPVAANDDGKHTLYAVADTIPLGENQLDASPLDAESLAPGFLGSVHLAPRAVARPALTVMR